MKAVTEDTDWCASTYLILLLSSLSVYSACPLGQKWPTLTDDLQQSNFLEFKFKIYFTIHQKLSDYQCSFSLVQNRKFDILANVLICFLWGEKEQRHYERGDKAAESILDKEVCNTRDDSGTTHIPPLPNFKSQSQLNRGTQLANHFF